MADGFFGHPIRRLLWSTPIFKEWSLSTTGLVDWLESPSVHIFKINVPGFNKDEIKVQVEEGNILHVKAEGGKEEDYGKGTMCHIAERGAGKREFSRQIELPDNVKADQIKAQVENGVLTIVAPKDNTTKQPKLRNIHVTSKL